MMSAWTTRIFLICSIISMAWAAPVSAEEMKQVTWKPGDEQVTVLLPPGLTEGENVMFQGQVATYVGIDETGVVTLDVNGNTEHYQGEPKIILPE